MRQDYKKKYLVTGDWSQSKRKRVFLITCYKLYNRYDINNEMEISNIYSYFSQKTKLDIPFNLNEMSSLIFCG